MELKLTAMPQIASQPRFFLWSDPTCNTQTDKRLQSMHNKLRNDEVEYYPPGDYIAK